MGSPLRASLRTPPSTAAILAGNLYRVAHCRFHDLHFDSLLLDGRGGGIKVTSSEVEDAGFNLVLDLTGACLSCGAAPGTLQGVKTDLEKDDEIAKVSFCSSLLDTFDDLGREFILAHGQVDFV